MAVHPSCSIAFRIFPGWKVSEGITMVVPLRIPARIMHTLPNMWDSGTERQSLSFSVNLWFSALAKEVFVIPKWVDMTPLGAPVVPEV